MDTNEKVYISNQLACMLPPLALKVLNYLVNWQSQVQIKYYSAQFSKMMHLDKSEIETAIQTLIDLKLISVSVIEQKFVIELENDQIKRYFKVPMSKVAEHEGYKLSSEITWNKEETTSSNSIEDMSEADMKRMLLMLQAKLQEKEEVKKIVVTSTKNDVLDDLPF